MPQKRAVTTSTQTGKPHLSAAERRAAQIAGLAGQQADLKREAAERRLARGPVVEPAPRVRASRRNAPS
jgi:hypothetical protein